MKGIVQRIREMEVGVVRVVCQGKEKNPGRKGAEEEYTCLSARGHFFIKHCTPPPSTGHLNSNSAVHTHCVNTKLALSLSLSLLTPSLIIRQFLTVAQR